MAIFNSYVKLPEGTSLASFAFPAVLLRVGSNRVSGKKGQQGIVGNDRRVTTIL